MTDTNVAYHAERAVWTERPAINVKVYAAGLDFWPPTFDNRVDAADRCVAEAYDRVQSDFWQAASEIADQNGLGEITQEGRSGGWLVFTSPGTLNALDPSEDNECPPEIVRETLAGYRSMVAWADAWIADAPRKVRDLAQQLAMDLAGQSAGERMFAR